MNTTNTTTVVFLKDFHIAVMVFDIVGSLMATSLNIVVIVTFIKVSSLRAPSNILILSLAFSDFGVGIIVQPFYCYITSAPLRRTNLADSEDTIVEAMQTATDICLTASLLTNASITIDRYLALSLHLRYKELVTNKRSFIVVFTIWVLAFSWSFVYSFWRQSLRWMKITLMTLILLVTFFLMVKISRVIRRHLQSEQQLQPSTLNMPRYKKSVNTMYYIIAAFVVCISPYICTLAVRKILTNRSHWYELYVAHVLSLRFMTTNSILNPIIYFWRIQEMRSAVFYVLQNVFCCQTRTPNQVSTNLFRYHENLQNLV